MTNGQVIVRKSSGRRAKVWAVRKSGGTGAELRAEWDRYLHKKWDVEVLEDRSGWRVRKKLGDTWSTDTKDWPSFTPVGNAVMVNIWSKIYPAIGVDKPCKRKGESDCCIVLHEKWIHDLELSGGGG